jgi:hypothetical protein
MGFHSQNVLCVYQDWQDTPLPFFCPITELSFIMSRRQNQRRAPQKIPDSASYRGEPHADRRPGYLNSAQRHSACTDSQLLPFDLEFVGPPEVEDDGVANDGASFWTDWEKTCADASAGRTRRDCRRRDEANGYSSSVLGTKSARFVTPLLVE